MSTRYLWAWTLVLALFGCGGKTPTEFPDPKPEAKIDANPKLAIVGQPMTISWIIKNATCIPSWRDGTIPAGSGSESYTPQAVGDFELSITCSGAGGTVSDKVSIRAVNKTIAILSPQSASIAIGKSVAFTWECQNGTPLSQSWSSPPQGTSSGTFSFIGTSVGSYVVTLACSGEGGTATVQATVTVYQPPTISGNVYGLQSGLVGFGDWRIFVTYSGVRDSVDVSPDGSFSIVADADSVDLIIDDKDTANRRFFPTLIALKKVNFGNVNVLRIPREGTISFGIYSGQKIAQSLELAYTPIPNNLAFYFRDNVIGGWIYHVNYLSKVDSPLMTAFDRNASTDPISPTDSIGFWSVIDSVESIYGQDLFKPANISELPAGKGLRVWVNRTMLSTGRAGPSNWIVTNGIRETVGATFEVFEPSLLPGFYIGYHELTHVLGFGHTCVWPTVMFSGFLNECGQEWKSLTLTAYDVAYKELMYAVAERMLETGAKYGLAEAHQGERVLMLGLPRQVIWYPNQ